MTDQSTRVVPAGWYEDPEDDAIVRWWNGLGWTDHTERKPEAPSIAAVETTAETIVQPAAKAPAVGLGFGGGYYSKTYLGGD